MALSENQQLLSKIATNDRHGENSPYFDGRKAYDNNPYHPIDNSEGVIQMGLAENQLCFDLIRKWIRRNPKASICTAEGVHEFKNIAIFQDYHGFKEFRQAAANFMRKARVGRVTFDLSRIVMSGGVTGANETVMFCLANPGDAFLVPSPCNPVFPREGLISNLIFCETHLDDSFTIINRVIWVVIICLPPIKVRKEMETDGKISLLLWKFVVA